MADPTTSNHTPGTLRLIAALLSAPAERISPEARQRAAEQLSVIADRLQRCHGDDGVSQIAAERDRQREAEGHSLGSDLMTYQAEELARAAACYALPIRDFRRTDAMCWNTAPEGWPFSRKAWKPARVVLDGQGSVAIAPADRVRELVKAGALIAAQIDVLQAQGGAR